MALTIFVFVLGVFSAVYGRYVRRLVNEMISDRSKGEQAFIHEYTRDLLVDWANDCIRFGEISETSVEGADVYVKHALSKGWLTKDGTKVTSAGFATAAARCKA